MLRVKLWQILFGETDVQIFTVTLAMITLMFFVSNDYSVYYVNM